MAASIVTITARQMRGFTADMLRRVVVHAEGFLNAQDGKAPDRETLERWSWEAVEAGFEMTEDIARFLVLKTRCDGRLFSEVLTDPDAEPVLRLIHMESQHPEVWTPMIGDLV